ncbi:hypothetical protein [Streptomyces sp. NPDC056194]|uniref:hypothetical protein n=1 Tax=unclassified Streptomyces TaxID=2593676 RepID=UPI0035E1D75A
MISKDGGDGIVRSGDSLRTTLSMFTGSDGHEANSADGDLVRATTTLHRDGEKIFESKDDLRSTTFPLALEDSEYTLTTSQVRADTGKFRVGTRIDAARTFRSKTGDTGDVAASAVRFHPDADLSSTAKAYRPLLMPYEIQGSAAGDNLKSLKVEASYDGGKRWVAAPIVLGKVAVLAPAAGKDITLCATIVDRQGTRRS